VNRREIFDGLDCKDPRDAILDFFSPMLTLFRWSLVANLILHFTIAFTIATSVTNNVLPFSPIHNRLLRSLCWVFAVVCFICHGDKPRPE
jgi:hypothetical protein